MTSNFSSIHSLLEPHSPRSHHHARGVRVVCASGAACGWCWCRCHGDRHFERLMVGPSWVLLAPAAFHALHEFCNKRLLEAQSL